MPPISLLLWSKITVDLVKKLDLVKFLGGTKLKLKLLFNNESFSDQTYDSKFLLC